MNPQLSLLLLVAASLLVCCSLAQKLPCDPRLGVKEVLDIAKRSAPLSSLNKATADLSGLIAGGVVELCSGEEMKSCWDYSVLTDEKKIAFTRGKISAEASDARVVIHECLDKKSGSTCDVDNIKLELELSLRANMLRRSPNCVGAVAHAETIINKIGDEDFKVDLLFFLKSCKFCK